MKNPHIDNIRRVLLSVAMAGWAENEGPRRRRKVRVFPVLIQEKELSCKAVVGGLVASALIDTKEGGV